MELTHVRLLADDVSKLATFYSRVLGLEQTLDAGGGIYVELAGPKVVLGIYKRDLMEGVVGKVPRGANAVLTFAVDDVDATFKTLVERGADAVTEPHDQEAWFLRVAHLHDPEGNLVEINASTHHPE